MSPSEVRLTSYHHVAGWEKGQDWVRASYVNLYQAIGDTNNRLEK